MNADVIIVGGGVIGNAAAYYLSKQGVSCIILEEEGIGHGGSSRNGGGVRQSARDVRELGLAMYGIENIWPTLADELDVDIEYHKAGNLRLAKTERHIGILQKLVESCTSAGLDVRMISGEEAREICPYMSEEVIGASWCPTDGHANPMLTTLAFYRKARMLGAHFITGERVIRLEKIRGNIRRVVTAAGNVYEGEHIIVAAGYGSRAILNTVNIDIPMQVKKIECLVTEVQPPMFWQMLGTADADFYGHQTNHGSFAFGGMCGQELFMDDTNTSRRNTNPMTAASTCRGIMKYFPVLENAKIVRSWTGFLDECVDHVAVIDKVSEIPGLIVACAFTGHGFGISPAVGKVLSELILGQTLSADISGLKYDRFKPTF